MRVCYFNPTRTNSRDRVIIQGLKKNGVQVLICDTIYKSSKLIRNIHLIKKLLYSDFDILLLGARGVYEDQYLVPFLRLIRGKPIIFDCIISIYETKVVDRKLTTNLIKKLFYYNLDYYAFKFSDLILTDTKKHAEYYKKKFPTNTKLLTLYIGTDDSIFYPRDFKPSDNFLVLFWGTFVPLQGVNIIIKAAKLLEKDKDIKFILKGRGQDFPKCFAYAKKLQLKNVVFDTEWVSYDNLPNFIAKADICLGIFGKSEKAKNVIPNKAYEAIAMRKPLITGASPAAKEIFINKKNALLCKMNSPEALAEAIKLLKSDENLRSNIAREGYITFKNNFTPEKIGRNLKEIISRNIAGILPDENDGNI